MSRFGIYAVYNDPRDGVLTEDDACFVGWDERMETYFFRSGLVVNSETDEPLIWLGTYEKEFEDFDEFLRAFGGVAKSPDLPELFEILETKS